MSKYSEMKVPALRDLCKVRGLKGYSAMPKAALVQYLETEVRPTSKPAPGTAAALKVQCKDEGLRGYSNLRKGELEQLVQTKDIAPIRAARTEANRAKIAAAPNYSSLTVEALKTLCRDRGIKGFSALRKADLIALIQSKVAVQAAA